MGKFGRQEALLAEPGVRPPRPNHLGVSKREFVSEPAMLRGRVAVSSSVGQHGGRGRNMTGRPLRPSVLADRNGGAPGSSSSGGSGGGTPFR